MKRIIEDAAVRARQCLLRVGGKDGALCHRRKIESRPANISVGYIRRLLTLQRQMQCTRFELVW